ncbi:MAG: hypothetical protein JXA44_09190 [Methanospirillaceae archaeon]|nr:hypothetical protein [Methanospirillaceae archaeon]
MNLTSLLTDGIIIAQVLIVIFGLLMYRKNRQYGLYLALGSLLLLFLNLLYRFFPPISSDLSQILTFFSMLFFLYATWLIYRRKV